MKKEKSQEVAGSYKFYAFHMWPWRHMAEVGLK